MESSINRENFVRISARDTLILLQWSAPNGVLPVIRRQRTRSLAFLQVEWIPTLADCTSASIPLSQVVSGQRGIHLRGHYVPKICKTCIFGVPCPTLAS